MAAGGRDNLVLIAAQEAARACRGVLSVEQNAKLAMRAVRGHWLLYDEKEQFKAALTGLLSFYKPESQEYEILMQEVRALNAMSYMLVAALSGGVVGPDMLEAVGKQSIGLLKIWDEVRKERVGQ